MRVDLSDGIDGRRTTHERSRRREVIRGSYPALRVPSGWRCSLSRMSVQEMATLPSASLDRASASVAVDVVVPVFNEGRSLGRSVRRLRHYLDRRFPFAATVTIADNASTDDTWQIATGLASELRGVRAVHVGQKGRGGALRTAWLASDAEVVAYMDVDLATDLDALAPLVAPLLSGHSDLAIGTRLARGAYVVRGLKRELISRSYNRLVRGALGTSFTDAQCGFKAVRSETARSLLPLVDDNGWFFDTELLVLAEREGLRIHEVPVDWTDDSESTVDIVSTASADLRGIARLFWSRHRGESQRQVPQRGGDRRLDMACIASVGLVSTLAYGVLFLALRSTLGPYGANALALTSTALANALSHRWLDPRPIELVNGGRLGVGLLGATGASLLLTTAALGVMEALGATSTASQVLALVVGLAAAAPVRFVAVHRALAECPPSPRALTDL
jgi:Glycosyl transferase family 2